MSDKRPWTRCPHDEIRYCPLYVACNGLSGGFGCDDGKMNDGCAIDRGMSYAAELERMRIVHPALIAQLAFDEQAAKGLDQRRRNMRLLGLH